ncbi:iron complex outermembrane receptor protein [Chitinophaga dinghuensis]|uniref:Iron complex outermembrane receptor protein n=1 Tax=Chitinophaga dinghuensis TaxID=1539050 RepID=A0A327VWG0_9BACT|nr:TonB-dependent receptor [Chitinophaga dinghuensis]RAJ80279.1 iron complex outermembrane receptor protein [Chitinophaga dinghuensis]
MRGSFFMLLTCMASSAAAQQQPDTTGKIRSLDEVIVQENRLSAPLKQSNRNITIISRRQIDAMAAVSINEVLAFVPGLDVRQRGPGGVQADIGLDGGTFDQTLVLVNGIKITDPQTGHNIMNLPVSLNDVDHIEVLRGAAARIYGINALNGAINIITRKAAASGAEVNGNLGSSFHRDDNNKLYNSYSLGASGAVVKDKSNQSLSASMNAGNGYRYNTAYQNTKALYQGDFRMNRDNSVSVLAGYVDNQYGANAYYAAPGDIESKEYVKTALAAVSSSHKITSNWLMTPRISYRFAEDDYRYIKTTIAKARNLHNTNIVDAELNNTFDTKIGLFGAGVEARYEHINSSNLGNHERTNLGAFAEYKTRGDKRLNFSLGGYLNYNTMYGWQFFPGADVGFNITPDLKVYATAGTAQRLPTYTDLYYKSASIIGNDQLGPEKAVYTELGIRKYAGKFNFAASGFYRQISDFIDYVKDSLPQPWQPQNFQRADTKGLTGSVGYNTILQEKGFFNSLGLNVGYNYLSPDFKGDDTHNKISRYVIESLRHQFIAGARTNIAGHFSVSANMRYCKRINYKDYTLIDARIAYHQPRFKIYADATNLLDVTYIEAGAVPMPGRWMTLGASFKLK